MTLESFPIKPEQPHGPMTLGNMRRLGVQRLLVSCLNPDCLHSIVFDVSHYDAEIAVPSSPHGCGAAGAQANGSTYDQIGKSN
jgi:hypothetical protein